MRFSIVIPVYNVAEYLRKCVESVLQNNCQDCEIILVDDGATDGICPALCDELAAEHPDLIRVIHQENRGLGGARNTGLENARGEYLFFVDSDDTIEPNTLEILSAAVEKSGADIIAFDLYTDDGEGTLCPVQANAFCEEEPFCLRKRKEFLLSLPSATCRVWRRELFLNSGIRYPSRVWYEDIRTTTKLFALADKIYTVDARLYRYLQRTGSIMNSASLERNSEILDAFDDILDWFEREKLLENYRDELCRLAVDHILLAGCVRVAKQDAGHPLLDRFCRYMGEHFPSYEKNPYIGSLPPLHKLLVKLVRGRHFKVIRLLFRIKDGR